MVDLTTSVPRPNVGIIELLICTTNIIEMADNLFLLDCATFEYTLLTVRTKIRILEKLQSHRSIKIVVWPIWSFAVSNVIIFFYKNHHI